MAGGYDLYGNYYSREIDALNAESAQCVAIDADRLAHQQRELQQEMQNAEHCAEMRIRQLEEKISQLEQTVMYLLGISPPEDKEQINAKAQTENPNPIF